MSTPQPSPQARSRTHTCFSTVTPSTPHALPSQTNTSPYQCYGMYPVKIRMVHPVLHTDLRGPVPPRVFPRSPLVSAPVLLHFPPVFPRPPPRFPVPPPVLPFPPRSPPFPPRPPPPPPVSPPPPPFSHFPPVPHRSPPPPPFSHFPPVPHRFPCFPWPMMYGEVYRIWVHPPLALTRSLGPRWASAGSPPAHVACAAPRSGQTCPSTRNHTSHLASGSPAHRPASGGGGFPCGGKHEFTNSGATKSVPLLKIYVWFPITNCS